MTRREKIIVARAVDELMKEDGNFYQAIDDLMGLIGGCYPINRIKRNPVSLAELAARGDSVFSCDIDAATEIVK